MNVEQAKSLFEKMGYVWSDGGKINLFGIRSSHDVTNKFDDLICAAFDDDEGGKLFSYNATTKAGVYYVEHPMNPKGCAILPPGQFIDAFAFGNHNGYPAIIQAKPFGVYRDTNLDRTFDYIDPLDIGLHQIDIHHAKAGMVSVNVDGYSAGCQVFSDEPAYETFLQMMKANAQAHGYQGITYTLFEIADLQHIAGMEG